MLSPDKGIRNLLPILDREPDELVLTADSDAGRILSPAGVETSALQAPSHNADSPSPNPGSAQRAAEKADTSETSSAHNPAASGPMAADKPLAAPGEHGRIGAGAGGDHDDGGSTSMHAPSSLSTGAASRAGRPGEPGGGDGDSSSPDVHSSVETDDRGIPASNAGWGGGPSLSPGMPGQAAIPLAVPDGDDLHIVQTAFVDQDAEILLNGWMGDSKLRVFMDNDADMDQDVDIDLDYDNSGRMFLRLNQFMTIDQETEIDVDIYEIKGVLYVDLHLRNAVDVEQDTELDLMMGGWNSNSLVFANNDLAVRQHTDVDVDIDDDLEEQFNIKVAVGIRQAIQADQDVDIDLTYANGAFGVDLDAIQTATIEQDTTLKIDFSVI